MTPKVFYSACLLVLFSGATVFVLTAHKTSTAPTAYVAPDVFVPAGAEAPPKAPGILVNAVGYTCSKARSIMATYFDNPSSSTPASGEPPIPTGSVVLSFNNRDTMTLTQTLSADGARYANSDESFVFWSKGDGAMILQDGQQKDYMNCVVTQTPHTTTPTVPATR